MDGRYKAGECRSFGSTPYLRGDPELSKEEHIAKQ